MTFTRIAVTAGVGAVVAALSIVMAGPAAGLPDQTTTRTIADGTVVSVTRSGEVANATPSMGGTPLHRNATVSGRYNVRLSRSAPQFRIQAGYVVGCQVSVGGLTTTGTDTATATATANTSTNAATMGGSLTVAPGRAVTYSITDYERSDPFGADQHKPWIPYTNTDHGSFSYRNVTLSVVGCAGYAQARSFVTVWVFNPTADQIVTIYGQPFSLG